MTERVPDKDELAAFLKRQLAEARRHGPAERVDDLLDKLANLDETRTFLEQVLNG